MDIFHEWRASDAYNEYVHFVRLDERYVAQQDTAMHKLRRAGAHVMEDNASAERTSRGLSRIASAASRLVAKNELADAERSAKRRDSAAQRMA